MSTEPIAGHSPPLAPPAPQGSSPAGRAGSVLLGLVAMAALASSLLLWQRLSSIQEQLARQSADSSAQAIEARAMAREAQELTREAAGRLAVLEARVGEVALQRTQLEELMHSLSRTRDENLVVDIEAALRLAQQQSQLTGSLQPLAAALKSASQRIERAAQPRLAPVQRAIEQDLERLARASVTDTAGLLGRLDDLVRQVEDLPLASAVAQAHAMRRPQEPAPSGPAPASDPPAADPPRWRALLQRAWEGTRDELRGLVRVRRIDYPEAMLLAPEQAYFLRENLKLKLLNARLAVLARRMDSARADMQAASISIGRYFDLGSRRTQAALSSLQQLQQHVRTAELPQLDDTFAALSTAAAGR
ncbi:uroporphyrinogen-III C-methyltransferase [Melaminivora alkalimesophila]|uniref:Uroporphyrin-3 C-methyltransferase n=1 Tax=Melaminivora alkalimesophila TaxID=1165852 RepID=A0A317RIE6_9BURK|nr:uroporphyrinogen-III C-methyltransferase [Melaminivora alkalimesophila]PWW48856.1 uroporphyrin-3 C-methyltransferase [Melaminivora alkalimesophila]